MYEQTHTSKCWPARESECTYVTGTLHPPSLSCSFAVVILVCGVHRGVGGI